MSHTAPQAAEILLEQDAPGPGAHVDTLANSVFILLAMAVVQRGVGFLRAVLFCRWLDPEQLGQWDMAFSFLLLAAPLSVLALPGAFGRYAEHFRQRGQLRTFLRRTMLVCAGLTGLAAVVVFLARRWFSSLIFGTPDDTYTVGLLAVSLVAVVAFNFSIELFTSLRNIRLVSVMHLVNSLMFAALGVVLVFGWRPAASSVVAAYGGACLLSVILAARHVRRTWREAPPVADPIAMQVFWRKLVPFAGWVLTVSILVNLFEVVDRYMIIHFSARPAGEALALVGNYHSSRIVPMLLVSLAAMLGAMITPHLAHDWEAGRKDRVGTRLRSFLKLFGFALCVGQWVVLAAAPLLFNVALKGKFDGGLAVLPWTLTYCTWFAMALIVQNYLWCAEKAWLSSVAMGAGLALNIVLNGLLLPPMGLPGAVLATSIANLASLGILCLFVSREGFPFDRGVRVVLLLPPVVCLG
ncbi:MAG: oligosaccharide flippase family protein, partial [Patescibacteria group bacterium]|nr:oligosaccharide flippase family protein [Patescibacteria group bacterium]